MGPTVRCQLSSVIIQLVGPCSLLRCPKIFSSLWTKPEQACVCVVRQTAVVRSTLVLQGSAVHNLRGDDSHTTGLPQPAAAVATAGQEAVHLQRYSLRKSGRRQQLQQAQLGGGDEGSGTEAGPKARRKRSPDDSFVQRPAKKRTGMGGGARGDAALLAEDGTEMVEGEGSGAAGAVNNGGTLAAMDSGMENAQRRRVLTRRKALS